MDGVQYSTLTNNLNREDSKALPKIDINVELATNILLHEACNGPTAKNVVCSPLSIEFALHMVAAGSKGNTLSQILRFLESKGSILNGLEELNLKSNDVMRVASSYPKAGQNKNQYDGEEPNFQRKSKALPNGSLSQPPLGGKRLAHRGLPFFYDDKKEKPELSFANGMWANPCFKKPEFPFANERWANHQDKEPELSFTNGIWLNHCYNLKPSYKQLMSTVYNAKAEPANFDDQADQVVHDINSWVADKTKNLIPKILEPGSLDAGTMLILVNALYFKGLWGNCSQFDENETKDKDFHLLDGSKVSVPFMSSNSMRCRYGAFDNFKVLQLNYQSGKDKLRNFCMQILLPDARDGIETLISKCSSDPGFLHQDFGVKIEKFCELKVPKFKFAYSLKNLIELMKDMGLTLPFELNCQDLTEMVEITNGGSLYVSKIFHKAVIEVNEEGTEAAAVTEVECAFGCSFNYKPPPPPTLRFVADHPFVFVIKEINTGAIFFVGAVFNPQEDD